MAAREQGFSLGEHELVTWVDPDDEVLDLSWIPSAIEALDNDPSLVAVYPRWKATVSSVNWLTFPVKPWNVESFNCYKTPDAHHLTIARKKLVLEAYKLIRQEVGHVNSFSEVLMLQTLQRFGKLKQLSNVGYHWKLRPNSPRTAKLDNWNSITKMMAATKVLNRSLT